jgi:NhaA family Na+:H+ antiporter
VALGWANSPWQATYEAIWETELAFDVGRWKLALDLRHWINDGLMALFFFVVGVEIKRELVVGELRSLRNAALPVLAALGGMVLPALLFLALNPGGDGRRGWGIAMATDIAFALGILALFGSRVPAGLKLLLLSVAIGAVIVIAVFYSSGLAWGPLAVAVGLLALIAALHRVGVVWWPVHVLLGVGAWLATYASGVQATIAGVALGLLMPTRPLVRHLSVSLGEAELSAPAVRWVKLHVQETISAAERLEHTLHPWTSYAIVPLFALANAGVLLSQEALAAAVAGIGFTMSLFIAGLAHPAPDLQDQARIGILAGSLLAAAVGTLLLHGSLPRPAPRGRVRKELS